MSIRIIREAADIFKQLSPRNQKYLLTLVRVAQAAEKGARKTEGESLQKPSGNRPA